MFKSCYWTATGIMILDDDFTYEAKQLDNNDSVSSDLAIIKVYKQKELNIGANLALFIIWYYNSKGISVNTLIYLQDRYLPSIVENWSEIVKERDRILKLIVWS